MRKIVSVLCLVMLVVGIVLAAVPGMSGASSTDFDVSLIRCDTQKFPFIYLTVKVSKDGQPVNDLTQANFSITEDGRLQTDMFHLTPPQAGGGVRMADIVFLIDTSGSMGDEIEAVIDNAMVFAEALAASNIDYRLGLIQFGNEYGSNPGIIGDGLTDDAETFKQWMGTLGAHGWYEPGFEAVRLAIESYNFRLGAQKVFILITDEDSDCRDKQTTIDLILANDVTVHVAVDCSFGTSESDYCGDGSIRDISGGLLFPVTGDYTVILDTISEDVASTYIVRYRTDNPVLDGIERIGICTVDDGTSIGWAEFTYIPGGAPHIQRTQETLDLHNQSLVAGTSPTIAVMVTDEVEPFVQNVILRVRTTGSASGYTDIIMQHQGGDLYTAQVPGSRVESPGLDYYIRATDGQVTSTDPSTDPDRQPYQIAVWPNEQPLILHDPPSSWQKGSNVNLIVGASDSTYAIENLTVSYRAQGEHIWQKIVIAYDGGLTTVINETCTLLVASWDVPVIEYYVNVTDDLGLSALWPIGGRDAPHLLETGNGQVVLSDDFSTHSGFWEYVETVAHIETDATYAGSAYLDTVNQYLVLTEPDSFQAGVVWLNQRVLSPFTAKFRYRAGGGSGADGLVFMFYKQKDYTPYNGGGLGFVAPPGGNSSPTAVPGYGIEFDNFNNSWFADPSANHIALIKDSVDNHLEYANDPRTNDNEWHDVKIVVGDSTIEVYVDTQLTLSWRGAIDRSYGGLGFSATTGYFDNWHIIDDFWLTMDIPTHGYSFVDLGNPEDEAFHNLVGWGDAHGPPENPFVSPSGDDTKRFMILRGENSVDLWIDELGIDYVLRTEVEDGACTDNFEIYVNGMGPIYTYSGRHLGAMSHEVLIPSGYITEYRVTVTFKNTSTDHCGLAAVYNVGLTPMSLAPANQPPEQPENITPDDGATDVSLTPTLASSTFSDPDEGDTHAASQWRIRSSTGTYGNPVFDSGRATANKTQINIPSGYLDYSITYYWQVRHQDDHGAWSELSTETFFTTAAISDPGDVIPPAAVTDLAATVVASYSVTLTWSAPGDDGNTGTASSYDIRYATTTITDANWGSASQCGVPPPKTAGSAETFTVTGLSPNTTYYFVMKTADEVPSWSALSNVASATTLGVIQGTVYVDDKPIQGAHVELDWLDGTRTSTSSNGTYTIEDVPAGSYLVRATVSQGGYQYRFTNRASVSTSGPLPEVDFGFSGNLAMVRNYAPILYLSSGENYHPCSFDFDGDLDVTNNPANYVDFVKADKRPEYYVYVNTVSDDKYFTIQYWLYYTYNDHQHIGFWDHDHDWECIYVIFDKDNLSRPVEVGFTQHSWVEYRTWPKVGIGTHPISYVALGSHANYFDPPPKRCLDRWVQPRTDLSPSSFTYEMAYDVTGWPKFTDDIPAPWDRDEWKETRPYSRKWLLGQLCSPAELRFYDSQGRVTGLVDGELKTEIPDSYCYGNILLLTDVSDSYTYDVVGTGNGFYDLALTYNADGATLDFYATSIPCSVGSKHRYSVDWEALARGEKGVILEIDADGDGVFEKSITVGAELTQEEFLSVTSEEGGIPFWVWIVVGIGAVAAVAIGVLMWRRVARRPAAT